MSESFGRNEKIKGPGITRRQFGKGGLAAGASAMVAVTTANSGVLDGLFKKDGKAERAKLALKNHALHRYMKEQELAENYQKFVKIREKLRRIKTEPNVKSDYSGLSDDERKERVQNDSVPILIERDLILAKLDQKLVPELLVTYAQAGLTESDKTLLDVYVKAGGNLERVVREGAKGLDMNAVSRIKSKLIYSGGDTGPHMRNFANPSTSPVEFEPRQEKKRTGGDSAENLA